MKTIKVLSALVTITSVFTGYPQSAVEPARERVRIVQQDISKWDKNRDGKLSGRERDEFLETKRKEIANAEAARRAASLNRKPSKAERMRPGLSPEDAQKPVAKGIPKNIEEAQR